MRRGRLAAALMLISACGGGEETTPPPPQPQYGGEVPGNRGVVDASGNQWQTYESAPWGIRLAVPNPQHCRQEQIRDRIGHLLCDYGELTIEVFSIPDRMGMDELRALAVSVTEIPPQYWRWEGGTNSYQGYAAAEAWSASSATHSMIGLIGQSGRRMVSHVVFIFGERIALERHGQSIETFIRNIEAI